MIPILKYKLIVSPIYLIIEYYLFINIFINIKYNYQILFIYQKKHKILNQFTSIS